jgi:hypothetical protein
VVQHLVGIWEAKKILDLIDKNSYHIEKELFMDTNGTSEKEIIARCKKIGVWAKILAIIDFTVSLVTLCVAAVLGFIMRSYKLLSFLVGFWVITIIFCILCAVVFISMGRVLLRISNRCDEISAGKFDSLGGMFDSLEGFFPRLIVLFIIAMISSAVPFIPIMLLLWAFGTAKW